MNKSRLPKKIGFLVIIFMCAGLFLSPVYSDETYDSQNEHSISGFRGQNSGIPYKHKSYVRTPVHVQWLGHATFLLSSGNKTILIDPFISHNPSCPITLDNLKKPDIVLLTHDHEDHLGDAIEIAKTKGSLLIGIYELTLKLVEDGVPVENVLHHGNGMAIGGTVTIDGIKITMVQAAHSATVGAAAGYIIQFPDGATIYHAGDTGLFSSMELIGKLYPIHIALLPIGSVFTMDAYQAAVSLRLLRPILAIPMHYGTFSILDKNADEFVKKAKKYAPSCIIEPIKPGESIIYKGRCFIKTLIER